ncbi:MAG TPA: hypothetical protein VLM38_24410 [Blastocatellia bacterium]|nr:hypothetical protein [Blastocatellia bacterium]
MTTTAIERRFEGPFKEQLLELASLIEWLQTEHDKSYVKAGDNKVYAFGGDGFVLVLDESVWDGQIELITPQGGVALKPGDDGKISVAGSASEDESTLKQRLREGIDGIRRYYDNRYWSTPTTAA